MTRVLELSRSFVFVFQDRYRQFPRNVCVEKLPAQHLTSFPAWTLEPDSEGLEAGASGARWRVPFASANRRQHDPLDKFTSPLRARFLLWVWPEGPWQTLAQPRRWGWEREERAPRGAPARQLLPFCMFPKL